MGFSVTRISSWKLDAYLLLNTTKLMYQIFESCCSYTDVAVPVVGRFVCPFFPNSISVSRKTLYNFHIAGFGQQKCVRTQKSGTFRLKLTKLLSKHQKKFLPSIYGSRIIPYNFEWIFVPKPTGFTFLCFSQVIIGKKKHN